MTFPRPPAAEGCQSPAPLAGGVGQKDVDLRRDGSAGAVKLLAMLADLKNAAMGTSTSGAAEGAEPTEALLFDSIARLGLPTNCDIDLRKRTPAEEKKDYLEVVWPPVAPELHPASASEINLMVSYIYFFF